MAQGTNVGTESTQTAPTDRSANAIREDIVAKRESIAETVDKLGERIHETFDWHEYVAEYPVTTLALAAGAGFLMAGIFKRRPTPQERILDAVAELTEEMTDRVGDVMSGVIQQKLVSGRTVKAAATALITRAAIDFAKSKLRAAAFDNNTRAFGQRPRNDHPVQSTRSSTAVSGG
jgi:ElaB/YqjD/DUF883 family membrane-anchored ribosome-binding protein